VSTLRHLEWEYDATTTFYGSIVDDEVVDFEVMSLIGGDWESVTIRHKQIEEFYKQKFYKWAVSQPESEPEYDDAS
jgi:hypothetical protein